MINIKLIKGTLLILATFIGASSSAMQVDLPEPEANDVVKIAFSRDILEIEVRDGIQALVHGPLLKGIETTLTYQECRDKTVTQILRLALQSFADVDRPKLNAFFGDPAASVQIRIGGKVHPGDYKPNPDDYDMLGVGRIIYNNPIELYVSPGINPHPKRALLVDLAEITVIHD